MINRNLVRRIIIEEFTKKVKERKAINELAPAVAVGAAALGAVATAMGVFEKYVDSDQDGKVKKLTTAGADNVYVVLKDFLSLDHVKERTTLPSRSKAAEISKDLADATIGGVFEKGLSDLTGGVLGLGTEEEDISDAIADCGSRLGLAYVATIFKEIHGEDFYKVYTNEMGPWYEEEYVHKPAMTLPFAIVNGQEVTEEEFMAQMEADLAASEEEETGEIKPMPFGVETPFIANIITTLNAYAKTRELENYTPCSGVKWTPAVQDCWLKVAPHALLNCDVFDDYTPDSIGGVADWGKVSDAMVGQFPGYTRNPAGCLAFCLDAYYCELRYGHTAPSAGPAVPPPSGGGGGGTTDQDGEGGTRSGGSLSKVQIRLETTGRNFTDSGFSRSDNENPDSVLKQNLINYISATGRNSGIRKTSMNFFAEVNNAGEVVGMKRIKWDGSLKDWKKRGRVINAAVKTVLDGGKLIVPDGFEFNKGKRGKGPKTINFTVIFAGGAY